MQRLEAADLFVEFLKFMGPNFLANLKMLGDYRFQLFAQFLAFLLVRTLLISGEKCSC